LETEDQVAVADSKVTKRRLRRVKSRAALTPELIVREALRLIDKDGLEGLSMRALAGRLGVEAMSLYHHFPSKHALTAAVSRLLSEDVVARFGNLPKDWKARIVALGRAEIETILAHPNAVLLMTARSNPGGTGYATIEAVLRALADAGLDAKGRLLWSRSIVAFINGVGAYFVPLTAQGAGDLLPPEPAAFPLTAEALAIRRKLPVDPQDVLERGLRPMFAAIQAEVAAGRRPKTR
jgi:AcrR family transcriptional regulator